MLFPLLKPKELPATIQFLCKPLQEVESSVFAEAKLLVADPPWRYQGGVFEGAASAQIEQQYPSMETTEIAAELQRLGEASQDARLAMWCTWPLLFLEGKRGWKEQSIQPWRYVSGGSWFKENCGGIGHHWLGVTEPVLLYVKGKPGIKYGSLKNGCASPVQQHSEKPWRWQAEWLERWTEPGDLVVDIFSGLAPMARACHAKGRRYIGIESSAERIEQAVQRFHAICFEEDLQTSLWKT
jgi:hypothetical protein